MDETFLRQAAALQANLKMLESQSASLTDLADMKELRQFKARLADYIDGHAAAGNLPRDPFQVIEGRLRALEDFFSATTRETKRLTSWRKDWTKAAPSVDLATLQGALGELDAMVAEVPQIQESLRAKISAPDWAVGSHTVELHQELLICASCVPGMELQKPARRQAAYEFAHGAGTLAEEVAKHFRAVGAKIREWISLHATHVRELAQIEQDVENHQIRSAERRWESLGRARFAGLNYTSAEFGLKKLQAIYQRFASCNQQLAERLAKSQIKAVRAELDALDQQESQPHSELSRETSALVTGMKNELSAYLQRRAKRRWGTTSVLALVLVAGGWLTNNLIQEEKKALKEVAEAKAKLQTALQSKQAGSDLEVPLSSKSVIAFAYCPAGTFTMGSPSFEKDRDSDEPQVKVTLTKGFWMAKTEVTQAQWREVMGGNPSYFKGEDLPVENLSWNDAQEFVRKVNVSRVVPEGWKLILPTEAQWEYACRASETDAYSGGTIEEVAWYDENSGNKTHNVGTKKNNAWGLYDMHGNVMEWCSDWHGYEPGGTDPSGPASGVFRVFRSGSWNSDAASCRAAGRYGRDSTGRDFIMGFRPALVQSE
jgi:formylglycine-generating enzyme required for sulfatase activity